MRYEDASHTSAFQGSQPIANDDMDAIPAGSKTPATGNLITGEGTQTGSAGADVAPGAHVAAIAGKGGEDSTFSGGKLSVSGEFGTLSVDKDGDYSYKVNAGVENVRDRFTYTLADNNGATDTGALIVEIGKTPVVIKANAQQIVPGPDGVVTLPPGVELSDIRVVGRNLVIDMPDGTQLIIVDGAIFVPQLVLNGVEIPSTNLAALLIGQEPQPAAGEAPQLSSGGNFEVPVPPLDPGVPLGDLIPPTEYAYQPPEPQEVFDILDEEPTIQIQPDGQPASVNAVDSVDEDGLPTRNGGEPEGSDEGADGNPSNDSDADEATSGVILYDSPDGVASITINGVVVTGVVGQVIAGDYGTLTITSIADGQIGYSYVLNDNIDHSDALPDHDDFSVVLVDLDGDAASATLTIDIVDDAPTARDDTDAVIKGETSTDGNVMTGADTTSGVVGADTVGADDAEVTGVHAGTSGSFTAVPDGGVLVVGQFGDLTLFPDGSYTYTLHAEVGNGGNDVFTYQLTDGDGDTDPATLTIVVPPDLKPTLDAPNVGEAGTIVDEAGLPIRGSEPAGTGEAADGNGNDNDDGSEVTTGTINFTPGDTPATITINGVVVAVGQTFAGDYGTLEITGFNPNGTINYSYTLEDNVDHDTDLTPFEEFDIEITDADGDTATDTLRIDIVDDAPIASNDTDEVTEDVDLVADGNVISGVGSDGNPAGGDFEGADDAIVTLVDGLNPGVGQAVATPGGVAIIGQYGTLIIQSDGTYSYTLDNTNPVVQALSDGDTLLEQFEYTLLDNDGDTDTAILTITINGDNDVPTVDVPTQGEDGTLVDEAGLPPRSGEPEGTGEGADGLPNNESDDSEITSGVITYTPGDGATTITIDGVVVAVGAVVPGDYGTLVITAFDPVAHTISYTYTLEDNVDHDSDPTPFESFDVVVADSDGNPADDATGTLIIDIVNDAPIARDDTDSVIEGAATNGNVLTGVGGDGNPAGADTPGADDYAPNTVVGVVTGGNDAVDTNNPATVGAVIVGTYGNLVLNANGTYTYTATAVDPPEGAEDVFTYTIIDNDGNMDSATLTIDVIDDLTPTVDVPTQGEDGTLVDEAGLPPRGSEPEGTGEGADGLPNNESDDSEITSGVINFTPGDTPATVTIDGFVVAAGLDIVGDYGTLHIDSFDPNGTITYTYTLNDNVDHDSDATPFETFTVTVTDDDGDVASDDLIIDIINDEPIARDDTDSVVEGAATNGNVLTGSGGDGNPAGADTPGADNYAPNTVVGVVTGGNDAVDTVNGNVGNALVGTYGSLTLNANGSYTYTANPNTNPPPGATDVFTYTIIDNDGNMDSATLTIDVIDDLVPDVPENTIVGLDDDALTGGNPGTPALNDDPDAVNTSGSVAAVGGDLPITYALLATGAPAGFTYQLQGNGDLWVLQGAALTHVLTITLDQSGNYTVTQVNPIDHAAGNLENNAPFTVTFRATDVDGDFDEGTLSISVDDDTPIASATKLTHTVDEDGVVENAAPGIQNGDGIAGGTGDVANEVVVANGNVSALFSAGADTPLTFNIAASVASLTAQGLTSGGVALSYSVGFNAITGVYTLTATAGPGGETVFTFTLDSATGAYSFTLVDQLDHLTLNGIAGDDTENDLDILLGSMIQATDNDGDTVTAAADGLNITVDDDSPKINGTVTDPLEIDNDATPSGTGTFDFDIGADQNSDFDDISVSNFNIQVNGVDADNIMFNEGVENATTASYSFTFEYDTGTGGTANGAGTLVFDKVNGTYTVELTSGPIEGISFSSISTGEAPIGYEDGTDTLMPSNPDVSVVQIDTDLFVQFSGYMEQGSGTGDDNFKTSTDNILDIPGDDENFANGEILVQERDYVTISGLGGNGVHGDTMNKGDILDFDLFTSNPTGHTDLAPTAQVETMFLWLDGIGANEDMIVILKLYDTVTDTFTTRAVYVGNEDFFKNGDTDAGIYQSLIDDPLFDNNDALVVFEQNDYNTALEPTRYVIVGAQMVTTDEGIVGSAINLNGAVGAAGATTGPTTTFAADTNDTGFKIKDIGFLTTTTEDQSATIEFDVTVEDADGDKIVVQDVTVQIGDPVAPANLPPGTNSSSFSLLASDSQDQQLQKTAANSNTLTLAAAIAAAGVAETQAAAAPVSDDSGRGHNADDVSAGSHKFVASAPDAADNSRSALSNETLEAANDSAPVESSSHGSDPAESDHVLDDSAAKAEAQSSDAPTANDQGPASSSVEASPAALAVGMPSAEALQAAGVAGNAQHGGSVEQIVAEALGHGNAPATVDALLNALPGGNAEVGALANLASPAAAAVPAWDMSMNGAFGAGHDMMMNAQHVAMHHDAVQPALNG